MLVETKREKVGRAPIGSGVDGRILADGCMASVGGIRTVEISPAWAIAASKMKPILVAVDEEDCVVLKEDYAWHGVGM